MLCVPGYSKEQPDEPASTDAGAAAKKPPPAKADAGRAALEKEFARRLTGAVMVGHYTVEGQDKPPAEERYELIKVTKLAGDLWNFSARVKFGDKDVTLPLIPLPVKWAGDTPMISVTKMTFPGLGTYTARVLFYGDHYAGTWSGGDHGGHLWGRIERKADDAKPETDKAQADGPKPDAEGADGATGGDPSR